MFFFIFTVIDLIEVNKMSEDNRAEDNTINNIIEH